MKNHPSWTPEPQSSAPLLLLTPDVGWAPCDSSAALGALGEQGGGWPRRGAFSPPQYGLYNFWVHEQQIHVIFFFFFFPFLTTTSGPVMSLLLPYTLNSWMRLKTGPSAWSGSIVRGHSAHVVSQVPEKQTLMQRKLPAYARSTVHFHSLLKSCGRFVNIIIEKAYILWLFWLVRKDWFVPFGNQILILSKI